MRRSRGIVALSLLFLGGVIPGFASGLSLHEAVPEALGMGQAYTALARGPLSPLWNPAGIGNLPGLQGALAVSFSSEGEGILLGGGSLTGTEGLAVAWTVALGAEGGAILGTLSFPIFTRTFVGGSFSYASNPGSEGISFTVGMLTSGEVWSLAGSLFNLGAGIFGVDRPLRLHIGASLLADPGVLLDVDLHHTTDSWDVALGAKVRVWIVDLHWGASISLNGGLRHVGLGLGFTLADLPIDLGLGLVGPDLKLWLSGGAEGTIPLW